MADVALLDNETAAAPTDYTVPGAQEIILKSVTASFDGTGAAGSFVPTLQILAPNGAILASCPTSTSVAAAGSADVSWFPRVGGSTPFPNPGPVTVLDYVAGTSTVTPTGTSDATATLVIQGNPIELDGATPILIEYWVYGMHLSDTISGVVTLHDGATDLGRIMIAEGSPGLDASHVFTFTGHAMIAYDGVSLPLPTAGTHTYAIYAWHTVVVAGNHFDLQAGDGGAGNDAPMWYRVTTASIPP